MILDYLFRGILIGLLFGLPVGVVGTMTIQRTWSFGFRAGLLTGLGSSVADCLYAVVGAFGLTVISDFLMKYQTAITVVGGVFVLYMGICLLLKNESAVCEEVKNVGSVRLFLSSFTVGITNPAAILTFLFAFTYFGIGNITSATDGILLVVGVLVGTYLWWLTLSAATCIVKQKVGEKRNFRTDRIFGCVLILFGLMIFLRLA